MCIWPFIFYKKKLTKRIERHELTHGEQQKELLLILFYILYGVFWVIGWVRYRDVEMTYDMNPFEQEAYENDWDKEYLEKRKHYCWIKYLF